MRPVAYQLYLPRLTYRRFNDPESEISDGSLREQALAAGSGGVELLAVDTGTDQGVIKACASDRSRRRALAGLARRGAAITGAEGLSGWTSSGREMGEMASLGWLSQRRDTGDPVLSGHDPSAGSFRG